MRRTPPCKPWAIKSIAVCSKPSSGVDRRINFAPIPDRIQKVIGGPTRECGPDRRVLLAANRAIRQPQATGATWERD